MSFAHSFDVTYQIQVVNACSTHINFTIFLKIITSRSIDCNKELEGIVHESHSRTLPHGFRFMTSSADAN